MTPLAILTMIGLLMFMTYCFYRFIVRDITRIIIETNDEVERAISRCNKKR